MHTIKKRTISLTSHLVNLCSSCLKSLVCTDPCRVHIDVPLWMRTNHVNPKPFWFGVWPKPGIDSLMFFTHNHAETFPRSQESVTEEPFSIKPGFCHVNSVCVLKRLRFFSCEPPLLRLLRFLTHERVWNRVREMCQW